jgi:hypothetical protein
MRVKAVEALLPLLVDVDDVVRAVAAAASGAFLPHLSTEEAQPLVDFVNNTGGVAEELAAAAAAAGGGMPSLGLGLGGVGLDLSNMGSGTDWIVPHARLVTLRAVMKYGSGSKADAQVNATCFASASVAALLSSSHSAAAKQQVREACCLASAWVVCASEMDGSGALDSIRTEAADAIVALCSDTSKDVRACAFSSLKQCVKYHPESFSGSAAGEVVRVLAVGVKTTTSVVKLAAERAALYFLQVPAMGPTALLEGLTEAPEDSAQVLKLYAGRVLVKQSPDSDDEEEDADYSSSM